jgi:hypothetical protein
MAALYISEFENPVTVDGTLPGIQLPQPALLDQTPVAIGGTSAQSAAFSAKTKAVMISTDAICSIAFGSNPTATTGNLRLPANTIISFGVIPGQRVAVISNT